MLSRPDNSTSRDFEPALESINARQEIESFLGRLVPLRSIARRMLKSSTFGFVTAALPGLEAFLTVERLRLIANEAESNRLIIVDGPATGGALEMLSVAASLKGLAARGALYRLALQLEEFLKDHLRFGVLITLTPEEMALREALDAAESIATSGIRCVGAIINRADGGLFSSAELERLREIQPHRELAVARQAMAKETARVKQKLTRAHINRIELPMLFRPTFGRTEIEMLANSLEGSLL
jgi:anion-transporting  ArsA/GET3 family ATPase